MEETGRLFESGPAPEAGPDPRAPLAERMRPRRLDEVVGQRALVGPGGLLRKIVDSGSPASLLLWGPPGVGKTTLARLLARETGARFEELSATAAGVKEVRAVAGAADRASRELGQRTVLFVDEIHRFHRGQQDALLPWVESGAVALVGATTENPSFQVVAPLLSRCRVVRLEPLSADELVDLLERALETPAPRGLGGTMAAPRSVLERIAAGADGDARAALNVLELAVNTTPGERLDRQAVDAALQRPLPRYSREEHFDQISALQKSIRNSDPDAALYWLARMIEAGEDPLYLARRLIRTASEDVGLADPRALELAVAARDAVQAIGLPEGALALAQAAIYLAVAPKSNALEAGWSAARDAIREHGALPVPLQLRNAVTGLMKEHGYGSGYRYAHDQPGGVAAMESLPDALVGRRFYRPGGRGIEARIRDRLEEIARLRRKAAAREGKPPASAPASEPPPE